MEIQNSTVRRMTDLFLLPLQPDAGTALPPPLLSPKVPSFRGGYDITVPWGMLVVCLLTV